MNSDDGYIAQPRRAATDSQVTREALGKIWRYSDLFGGPQTFADEVMEIQRTAGELLDFPVPLCTTPEELDDAVDRPLALPLSSLDETRARPRRPSTSSGTAEEAVRVFHSKDFGTNATADDTRPAWWSQWVERCRHQESQLFDKLLHDSGAAAPTTGEASEDTKTLDQAVKQAFKQSQLWQGLEPFLHHYYSELYTRLVVDQQEQEPSSSLDLRPTDQVDVYKAYDRPYAIEFHLEARLKAMSETATAEEGEELEGSPAIKTEFFGVKHGHNDSWNWEVR